MTNTTTQAPPRLRLGSPEDVLAVVPYVLGFHPDDNSLVVLGLGGRRMRLRFTTRLDFPAPCEHKEIERTADYVARVVASQRGVNTALLVAYGTAEAAGGLISAVEGAMQRQDIPLKDVLRVQGDRYWSYLCKDPGCHPLEGTPYDISSNAVAAAATVAGCVALPDRAALAESIAPLGGITRESMRQATDRAEARVDEWACESTIGTVRERLVDEGQRLIRAALDRYRTSDTRLPDDDIAWLGVLLKQHQVRDEAWLLIDAGSRCAQISLWTDMLRRLEPAYIPAPASLLAFAAWRGGDGALAWVALDRAREVEPDYSMAALVAETLMLGIPPDTWKPLMTMEELRDSYRRAS